MGFRCNSLGLSSAPIRCCFYYYIVAKRSKPPVVDLFTLGNL